MANELYMVWGDDWEFDDDLFNTTNWTVSGTVTQFFSYVEMSPSSTMKRSLPSGGFPMTFEMLIRTKGTTNAFRLGSDNSVHWYINFPDTGGVMKYYRLIIRGLDSYAGAIYLYENGQLIKSKWDGSISDPGIDIKYVASTTAGDYLQVHRHRHLSGADLGDPPANSIVEPIYLDGRGGYELLFNRIGAGLPPREFIEDTIPFVPGSIYRDVIIHPRDITLGLKVIGSTRSDLYDKMKALYQSMKQNRKLLIKMSDGYKYLLCKYMRGLEGDEREETTTQIAKLVTVTFRAFDPYWYAAASYYSTMGLFSNNTQTMTITTNGDTETWPEFYIHGPGTNPQVRNNTTGQSFTLNVTLATSSDWVYINTKPGARTIKDKNGAVSWNLLSTSANQLWSLAPGDNSVTVTFSSGTDSTTFTRIIYNDRILGV